MLIADFLGPVHGGFVTYRIDEHRGLTRALAAHIHNVLIVRRSRKFCQVVCVCGGGGGS